MLVVLAFMPRPARCSECAFHRSHPTQERQYNVAVPRFFWSQSNIISSPSVCSNPNAINRYPRGLADGWFTVCYKGIGVYQFSIGVPSESTPLADGWFTVCYKGIGVYQFSIGVPSESTPWMVHCLLQGNRRPPIL